MDASSSLDVPLRSSARLILPSSCPSLMDKFLGLSISPASAQSLFSDTTDANEADELDEQDLWSMEIGVCLSAGASGDGFRAQACPPPRILSAGKIAAGSRSYTPGRCSPLGSCGVPRVSSVVNSLISISSISSPVRSHSGRIFSAETASRRVPFASRMIPKASAYVVPQSAPLNVPDWSKFQRRRDGSRRLVDDDYKDDEEEERLPPHEFLAREYAKSQGTSFSVLEGVGRTLKGRDMARVRTAVLSYTGFLE